MDLLLALFQTDEQLTVSVSYSYLRAWRYYVFLWFDWNQSYPDLLKVESAN